MKYFVIADVHGYYDEMLRALEEKGFDRNNPNHTLVSLGDAMDRGSKPLEVIKYFLSLDRKILIRGNHEDLLYSLLTNRYPNWRDINNGTLETFIRLVHAVKPDISSDDILDGMQNARYLARKTCIMDYYDSLVNFYELDKFIFCHGWIPYRYDEDGNTELCGLDEIDPDILRESRWVSGIRMVEEGLLVPGKTILCGHWHASLFHEHFNHVAKNSIFTPFKGEGFIALDGATAISGIVNCVVLDDDGSVII